MSTKVKDAFLNQAAFKNQKELKKVQLEKGD